MILSLIASHPSRVRGLKPTWFDRDSETGEVAPLAGAWIETPPLTRRIPPLFSVAPLAGAWIET